MAKRIELPDNYIGIYDKDEIIGYINKYDINIGKIKQTGYVPVYHFDMGSAIMPLEVGDTYIQMYNIDENAEKVKPTRTEIETGVYIPIYDKNMLIGVVIPTKEQEDESPEIKPRLNIPLNSDNHDNPLFKKPPWEIDTPPLVSLQPVKNQPPIQKLEHLYQLQQLPPPQLPPQVQLPSPQVNCLNQYLNQMYMINHRSIYRFHLMMFLNI